MKKLNWFYISLIVLIPVLIWILKPEKENEIAFYGLAENLETEINYNYDVVIDQILVRPGQMVKQGSPILQISRKKSKEVLDDQSYEINTILADQQNWIRKKNNEIELLKLKKNNELAEIQSDKDQLDKEISAKRSLISSLNEKTDSQSILAPLLELQKQLDNEALITAQIFDQQVKLVNDEINLYSKQYKSRITELEAERSFDAEHKIQHIEVNAPSDGLIGNIYCKEAEHVPAFSTLLTFYEPHSGLIKGFVHEDLTMTVKLGDEFLVSSLKNMEIVYSGKVIGLGSRIIEIPSRLRKFPHVKSYGREITIEIPTDNIFLQKEKVGLKIK